MALVVSKSLKSAQLAAVNRMLAFNDETMVSASYYDENEDNDDPKNGNKGDGASFFPSASSSLSSSSNAAATVLTQWKILIYDKECRSIISPLLSVGQLRRRGVTLHLLLHSDREPIPDVPAVYFCRPTRTNVLRIAQDCAQQLYRQCHVNFVTKLDRALMEDFARSVVETSSLDRVASLHDQYLDYQCLERNLFSLHKENCYARLNGPGATEREIDEILTSIAYGLFSVIATLGAIPIIRCPRNGAPEMVARKVYRMILEHPTLLRSAGSGGGAGVSRPLLVLMDRNRDLLTPVQHASTYQALLDDLLHHRANRVEFSVAPPSSSADGGGGGAGGAKSGGGGGGASQAKNKIPKKYDLDPDKDPFYAQHKFLPFPEAIESNGVELQQVTQREREIRSTAGGGDGGAAAAAAAAEGASADLAHAVDSLPALLNRKKQLEVHTSILQAIMNEVASRDVPQFFELESSLTTGSYANDPAKAQKLVMELVADPNKGNVTDKVRLVLTYSLGLGKAISPSDIDAVATAMKDALETKGSAINSDGTQRGLLDATERQQLADGMKAIQYLKQLRSTALLDMASAGEGGAGGAGGHGAGGHDGSDPSGSGRSSGPGRSASDGLSSFMKSATNQATGFLAKATEKMGSMLGKAHKCYATRVVEHLCDMKPGTEDDSFLYLDPKVGSGAGGGGGGPDGGAGINVAQLRANMARAPVRDVIAFVIGGGCYSEYQNLQTLAARHNAGSGGGSGSDGASGGRGGVGAGAGGGSGGRTISYGSTELLDPCQFVAQLSQLGS